MGAKNEIQPEEVLSGIQEAAAALFLKYTESLNLESLHSAGEIEAFASGFIAGVACQIMEETTCPGSN